MVQITKSTFIQIGCDPPELDEVMLLELQSKADVVKVVKGVDGRLETVVILFLKSKRGELNFPSSPYYYYVLFLSHLNEEAVQTLVDSLVVEVLHGAQVRLHELQMVDFSEEVDGPRVIHPGRQHQQQVVEQHGLEVQVKLYRLVIQLDVGHLR